MKYSRYAILRKLRLRVSMCLNVSNSPLYLRRSQAPMFFFLMLRTSAFDNSVMCAYLDFSQTLKPWFSSTVHNGLVDLKQGK